MVSRTLLMYIAVDKGADVGKRFVEYIDFLEMNGYIGSQNKAWVDKIRKIGNKYTHEMGMATQEDADKVTLLFLPLLKRSSFSNSERFTSIWMMRALVTQRPRLWESRLSCVCLLKNRYWPVKRRIMR